MSGIGTSRSSCIRATPHWRPGTCSDSSSCIPTTCHSLDACSGRPRIRAVLLLLAGTAWAETESLQSAQERVVRAKRFEESGKIPESVSELKVALPQMERFSGLATELTADLLRQLGWARISDRVAPVDAEIALATRAGDILSRSRAAAPQARQGAQQSRRRGARSGPATKKRMSRSPTRWTSRRRA